MIMEFIAIIQNYGIMGLLFLLTFQYVVRPLVVAYINRRKNNNGNPGPAQSIKEIHEIITAKDSHRRCLIYGDDIKDAIEKLTEAIENLTEEIKS